MGVGLSGLIIILVVICIVLYHTSKGEHTALYKVNKNVYSKTSEIIIILS